MCIIPFFLALFSLSVFNYLPHISLYLNLHVLGLISGRQKKGKTETKKKGNPRPSCKDVLAPESVTIIHRIASNGAVVYHTKPLCRLIRSGPCAVPTQPFRTFDLQVARLDVVCAGDQHG